MCCASRVLVLVVLCGCSPEAGAQCAQQEPCQEAIMECVQTCKSSLTPQANGNYVKNPFHPGSPEGDPGSIVGRQVEEGALQPVSLEGRGQKITEEAESAHEDKRSYPMEHFRWGKPVGRKRRPVKVYSNGMEEDLTEAYPTDMRRQVPEQGDYGLEEDQLSRQKEDDEGSYRLTHSRWAAPVPTKRYGGFMKSWGGHSQKSLLTLFKNIITKDGHR